MTQRASPVKYNLDLLIQFCNENHITLLKDYSGEKVNRETIIHGKCLREECGNSFERIFRSLYNLNGYCKECTSNNVKEKKKATWLKNYGVENPMLIQETKEKIKATNLEKYGFEHPLQSQKTKEKIKATCLEKYGFEHPMLIQETKEKIKATCLEKYGVEYSLQSQEVKEKGKATCSEKYGVEHPMLIQEVKEKIKATCLEKYGVENPMLIQETKEKIKATNLEKYGFEHPLQSQKTKEKIKATCLEKYGFEHPMLIQETKEKIKATCLEKYGVEYSLQSQEVKEKGKVSCLEKYGVEYAMQNPDIADKSSKASYSRKDYTLPSGKIIQVQGYEPYTLDDLVKIFNEDEIKTGSGSVPEIWYDDDEGLKHRHFVDIFIPSQNKCIEVKSTWTAEKKKDNIFKKQQAGKQLGYNYEIWIYNSKGEKVECII